MFERSSSVPAQRVRRLNERPINTNGQFVLYWMTAFRRPFYNFALQRAIEQAKELRKPLLILEALRSDYPYASDRLHRFILGGMADNAEHFARTSALYFPYVETEKGSGKGLLVELAKTACLVVADDCPAFFLPRMLQAAADRVDISLEVVDSNGLLPLHSVAKDYPTAFAFRRFLQKELPGQLFAFPQQDPLRETELSPLGKLPEKILQRWPQASAGLLAAEPHRLAQLPIDHSVVSTAARGGWREADEYLQRFLKERLPDYPRRSEPDREFTSELSPYLHFGQIASHQIIRQLIEQENWSPDRLSPDTKGKRSGWWGMSEAAESFLDELITWREIGLNASVFRPDYDQYSSLPDWARESLGKHREDPRPYLYNFDQFEQANSHDRLWNAAQNQLRQEGRIHNYLRMLWGKKILEWSIDPETALQTMLTLNDRYALDGRDPNSVSGIFWCLGRYDRAWGPERPIYGKIRYMSSENTVRKFSVKNYLERYAPEKEKQK